MSGPPFNPLIDLDELSHEKFVDKASEVITRHQVYILRQ